MTTLEEIDQAIRTLVKALHEKYPEDLSAVEGKDREDEAFNMGLRDGFILALDGWARGALGRRR